MLFLSCVGCAAMECHGNHLPGRFSSTGAKDTMSTMVKPAKEFHEFDVGQPTAACQVMVCPSRRTLVTKGPAPTREGWSRRHRGAFLRHGDADDVFPRQAVESNALLFSLDQPTAEVWPHGEVDALDSHEHSCSDLRKRQRARATCTSNRSQA